MLVSDLCWDYYLGIVPNVVRLYQYWGVGQCLVLFYNHFHYRIRFNDFRYEIRFWWSVNGFWYENRITNKSSPSLSCHTSDKSFLLWKWNLWCIIWFSLWKWPFILYDSCYSRGAPAPFHFMVGVSDRHSNRGNNPRVLMFRRESESLISLWITHGVFIRETRVHPSQLYMLISGFIILLIVNQITVHEPMVSLASPRFRALPPTTNTIQSNRYCSR